MASKKEKVPVFAQAVITKCELCDHGEARYFCNDCQEDMCKNCKSIHLRSKLGRNHEVIGTAKEVEEEKPVFCTTHTKELIQMFCNDCNIPICHKCIANKEHRSHDLDMLADAVDKCRKELSKYISETKQEISELKAIVNTLSSNKKEYESQHNDTIDGINDRREELISQVNKAADDLIKETKKRKGQGIKELEKHKDDMTRIMADKQDQVQSCEDMLQTKRGFPIIQLSAEFKQKLNLGSSTNLPRQVITAPRFVCGKPIDIQGVFGGLELGSTGNEQATGVSKTRDGQSEKKSPINTDQTKGTSTTIDTSTIRDIKSGIRSYCVSTVNDKEAWVAHGLSYGSDIALIDINGQVKKRKKMDFRIWDIAVTSDGDVLLTEYNGQSIKKHTQDDNCVDVMNTSPSSPYGICITSHKNDILVCLQGGSGGTRVVRMTTNGQVKQTIKQDHHYKDLFKNPNLITENINGDVCAADGYKTVVVVNTEGVLRFRYPDKSKPSNNIQLCAGIACDSLGYILISDQYSHQVHQIDRDGRFIQYVLTQQHHGVQSPWGLSIDTTGKLWMCDNDGNTVPVVKYRS